MANGNSGDKYSNHNAFGHKGSVMRAVRKELHNNKS